MDLSTQSHLKTLRDALEFRRGELRAEVHAADLARRTIDEPDAGDFKEASVREQAADMSDAEERRDVEELQHVEAALNRLDIGRYGDCADCGEPIGMPRLLVQPAAERCVGCQTDFERRRDGA
ncbi:MAG: TraR/DksA family transcriptional regulator [Caldimonas sp.]